MGTTVCQTLGTRKSTLSALSSAAIGSDEQPADFSQIAEELDVRIGIAARFVGDGQGAEQLVIDEKGHTEKGLQGHVAAGDTAGAGLVGRVVAGDRCSGGHNRTVEGVEVPEAEVGNDVAMGEIGFVDVDDGMLFEIGGSAGVGDFGEEAEWTPGDF